MGEHEVPTNSSDSAGFPWQGRSFEQHSEDFAGDIGLTPPELADVIARFQAGKATHQEVADIFSSARVLIPLLTVAGEVGETPDGRIVDKTQELSIVTVQAPDGRNVLPVFSSVEAMKHWNPDARPVPNYGRTAALAALNDGNELLILDPTHPNTEFGFRRPILWAIANGEARVPCWRDDEVLSEFERSIQNEEAVRSVTLDCGDREARLVSPELIVLLELEAGLNQAQLAQLLERLQARWAASQTIAERVDSMTVRVTAA